MQLNMENFMCIQSNSAKKMKNSLRRKTIYVLVVCSQLRLIKHSTGFKNTVF